MKKLELAKATAPLAKYALDVRKEPVVLTERGKPVAALVAIEKRRPGDSDSELPSQIPGAYRAVTCTAQSERWDLYRGDASSARTETGRARQMTAGLVENELQDNETETAEERTRSGVGSCGGRLAGGAGGVRAPGR